MAEMCPQCPLQQGEGDECYLSESCGGDGVHCPFPSTSPSRRLRQYWQAAQSAYITYNKFAQIEGIWVGMQCTYRSEAVVKQFEETYRGSESI